MHRLRLVAAAVATAAAVAIPTTAFADSCANVSRAPAPCGFSCPGPVVEGNWVWLPSIGVPFPAWGFAPPGGPDSVNFGMPGANGNYLNFRSTQGSTSLLGRSVHCLPSGDPTSRQQEHGIQSGCE